jgi:hypothetical protein
VADDDTALGEQILDVAEAKMEAEVQPDGVGDHIRWEAVATVERRGIGAATGHRPSLPVQLDNPPRNAVAVLLRAAQEPE